MKISKKKMFLIIFILILLNFLLFIFSNEVMSVFYKPVKINLAKNLLAKSLKKDRLISDVCVNNKKYIRFECKKPLCGGWADRLRGLMSAYILANFTKREFLIDIDHPCSLSLMLQPNVIKWNEKIRCHDFGKTNIKNNFTSLRLNKIDDTDFQSFLRNLNIFEYFKDTNLFIVRTNNDWIREFSFNKHLNESIHQFGYKPQNFKLYSFFRKLYNDLFKLTPSLQKRYNEFLKEAKPDNQTKLICAQVRIGGARPNVHHDKQFASLNNSKYFWDFIRNKFLYPNPQLKYKIFVTSDTKAVQNECIEEFGKENIVKIDGPFTHIDRDKFVDKNDCSRFDKVILDFHALQNCDIAIIGRGGYGRLGISNRIEPTKDLYRFQTITEKKNSVVIEKYIFKKIEHLNML